MSLPKYGDISDPAGKVVYLNVKIPEALPGSHPSKTQAAKKVETKKRLQKKLAKLRRILVQ